MCLADQIWRYALQSSTCYCSCFAGLLFSYGVPGVHAWVACFHTCSWPALLPAPMHLCLTKQGMLWHLLLLLSCIMGSSDLFHNCCNLFLILRKIWNGLP